MLDAVWKEHLLALDHLRQGIGLRAYGQRDPLNEYKREAFALFDAMLDELKERVTTMLSRVELAPEPVYQPPPQPMFAFQPEPEPVYAGVAPERAMLGSMGGDGDLALELPPVVTQAARSAAVDPDAPATWANTPRNAPCPCGSGKKYKHCHGRLA